MTTFSELGLKPELAQAVADLGFTQPTPIQEQAIPELIQNPRDLVGLARTGTGKTAAFGLPLLHFIDPEKKFPQALVLCPTRELCIQITEDLKTFAKHLRGVSILPVYGGASISMQIQGLRRGVQVIVGTPGRLNDMIERGALKLGEVQTVVLDEADEMLNMGFREAIDTILAETPKEKNTWLFSATMPSGVERIARSYMTDPFTVTVKGTQETDGRIDHFYCVVQARDRYSALRRVIDAHPDIYGIIFCRTKMETQEVADHLGRDGYMADAIHGDLSQQARDHVMKRFRTKSIQILVATDVAARGIDVDDVTHVLHYQLPDEPEAYTHRSGRTGRAGKNGISIVFLHAKETGKLRVIERLTQKKLIYLPVPDGVDVLKNQLLSFSVKLRETKSDNVVPAEYVDLLKEAMGEMTEQQMLEKFMALNLAKLFADYSRSPDLNVSTKPRERGERLERPERAERGYEEATGDKHTYFISIGRMDNVDPGQLLRILCDHLNTDRTHIGKIDLKHNFSFVQLIGLEPTDVMNQFKDFDYKGRPVRVNQAENESGGGGDRESRPRREGGFGGGERSFGGERKSFGDRKPYEKKSYGSSSDKPYERKSFGDRKPFEKKSFGSSADRPQRRSAPVSETPGKGFGKPDKADRGEGDWKSLINDGSDRKKKFGKKKF
ncbi:MAG: DEAD/DEAH box helicase [Bacteroidia bacterium]